MTCWVRNASRAAFWLGSARASSKELVCSDCVPPRTAPRPCSATRTMLTSGCCAVSCTPAVWVWKRNIWDLGFLAPNSSFMMCAQMRRAARNLATSSSSVVRATKKKESRGAKSSISRPAASAVRTYSLALARGNTISISGYHMAEAGATPAQEIAFTLANAKEYVRTALAAGLEIDDFAPRLSFFFVARTTLLEEVAKFRAARRIWAHIMKDEFGAKNPKSQMLRFHTQTAGVQLTAQQPEVNMVRVALQGLGAVFGGTQSLHTNSFDEALSLPSQKAARLALRTQQVIAFETDVCKTVDPFAGSYVMESMTDDVEDAVLQLMQQVEDKGGAVAAIEQGFQKAEIERSAYRIQLEIDGGERVVVGLNKFNIDDVEHPEPLLVNPRIEEDQCERLAVLRKERNNDAVSRALDSLRTAAEGTDNVLVPMKEALAARATGGEVCHALRDVWGVYVPNDTF